jgi:hypothetical protein
MLHKSLKADDQQNIGQLACQTEKIVLSFSKNRNQRVLILYICHSSKNNNETYKNDKYTTNTATDFCFKLLQKRD